MKQRGKKSTSSLSVVSEILDARPRAPEELNQAEARVWKQIVDSKPHDWFGADSHHLLVAYCRNVVAATERDNDIKNFPLATRMEREGFAMFEKLNKLKDMHEARAVQLATKMRLTQQARYTTKAAGTADKNTAKKKLWEA